jgi:hypothetical protein
MTIGLRRLLLVLAVIAIAGGAARADGDEGKVQAVRAALAAGQPVVLALAKELPSGDSGDETDADWAFYLNEFAAGHRSYEIVAMSAAEARELLAELPPLEEFYATIFARSAKSAVIYDGAVLEPWVYDAGAAYLDAPQDGQFDAEMFTPFDLRLK